jgi:cation transport ATPase
MVGVVMFIGAATARAELVAVDQSASGMECPECSRGLRMAVRVLDGVEALETSWNRRRLTARFRIGSRATLEEIRNIIRARHFVPREAQVTVRGTLAPSVQGPESSRSPTPTPTSDPRNQKPEAQEIRLSGSGVAYQLETGGSAQIASRLQSARGHAVVIRGRVPAPVAGAGAEDPLLILVESVELSEPIAERSHAASTSR